MLGKTGLYEKQPSVFEGSHPLLNKHSGLSIRNGLHFRVRKHAANSHVSRLQALRSNYLHVTADAHKYISNLQPYKELNVPYLAENIRNLAQGFDSNFSSDLRA